MLFSLKKKKPAARVLRIPRQEWTVDDMAAAKFFFLSETYRRVKAVCDGHLARIIVTQNTSDDYRKGWMDCQRQHEAFADVADPVEDSTEFTSMQFEDN